MPSVLNTSAMWPVLPDTIPAERFVIRSGNLNSSGTLFDADAVAVGRTLQSRAGVGPALGSTAELHVPLSSISTGVSTGLAVATAAWDGSEIIGGAHDATYSESPPVFPVVTRDSEAASHLRRFL